MYYVYAFPKPLQQWVGVHSQYLYTDKKNGKVICTGLVARAFSVQETTGALFCIFLQIPDI